MTELELDCAKNATKSAVLTNLESRVSFRWHNQYICFWLEVLTVCIVFHFSDNCCRGYREANIDIWLSVGHSLHACVHASSITIQNITSWSILVLIECWSHCRKPLEHFFGILDELTVDDLRVVAQRMLSSPLSMACCGDGSFYLIFPLCSFSLQF